MGYTIAPEVNSFTDLLIDAVCVVDAGGKFLFVSAACERIFGYTQHEMVGMTVAELVAPADRERTMAAAQAVMSGRSHIHFENRYVRKDGGLVHLMWSARWSEADGVRVAIARDITELKQAQARQAALYALSEAVQANGDLAELSARCHAIIREVLPATGCVVILAPKPDEAARCAYLTCDPSLEKPARRLCDEALARQAPLLLAASEDADGPAPAPGVSMLALPLQAAHETLGVLALYSAGGCATYDRRDLGFMMVVARQLAAAIQRKQLETRLHRMAMHDELTGLPNRRLFLDRIHSALARAQRQGTGLALLFIDLNRFKLVNDRHGHLAGDRLLREVARRLGNCLRDSDTLARLGGDEFVILLEHTAVARDAAPVADKIAQLLSVPFDLGEGLVLRASASIGIACYPEHGSSVQELLSRADQKMYCAKQKASDLPAAPDVPLAQGILPA